MARERRLEAGGSIPRPDKRMGEAQASDPYTDPHCLTDPLIAAVILFVSTPGVASGPLTHEFTGPAKRSLDGAGGMKC